MWRVVRERVAVKSPVRENRPPGSVRGAPGNRRPYRDPFLFMAPNLHPSHSDGNANHAPREGARPAGSHRCSSRPAALTRRLEV